MKRRHISARHCTRLGFEPLGARVLPANFIAVGTDAGTAATVRLFADTDDNGTYETRTASFQPFESFSGGVRVALGDFNGDGNAELVTAQGTGGNKIRIWTVNGEGTIGERLDNFAPFGTGFKGGLYVALGDLNSDGRAELAVSQGSDGSGVRIYSDTNRDGKFSDNLVDTVSPFGAFAGGTRLAMGNTNNLAGDELIAATGPGVHGTVSVFTDSDADRAVSDNPTLEGFTPFGTYSNGLNVAVGKMSGAGTAGAEIMVAREAGSATVKIFTDSDADGLVGGELFDRYNPFPGTSNGARLAAGDTDSSGVFAEVIAGRGPGGTSDVTIQGDSGDAGNLLSDNPASDAFRAFAPGITGGVFLAFGKVTGGAYASFTGASDIPDLGTLSPRTVVPVGAGVIRNMVVNLAINHTFDADLDITLRHVPSGTAVNLLHDVGDSSDGFMLTLINGLPTNIQTATAAAGETIHGSFAPAEVLTPFFGLDASGEWVLDITDDTATNTGRFFGWSLTFVY